MTADFFSQLICMWTDPNYGYGGVSGSMGGGSMAYGGY